MNEVSEVEAEIGYAILRGQGQSVKVFTQFFEIRLLAEKLIELFESLLISSG